MKKQSEYTYNLRLINYSTIAVFLGIASFQEVVLAKPIITSKCGERGSGRR